MGPASITSFCTGRPWQRRDCARDRWRFYARPAPAPPLDAASGWPQRLVPAFGVIGPVLSRKNNVASFEACSHEGWWRTWCVPAGTGRPRDGCVPTAGVSRRTQAGARHRQDRSVPTAPRLGPSMVTAGSGWPQRLALVFGVIGQVVSRKSNVARVEAGSRQGQRRGPSQLLLSNSCCGWYRCQRLDL